MLKLVHLQCLASTYQVANFFDETAIHIFFCLLFQFLVFFCLLLCGFTLCALLLLFSFLNFRNGGRNRRSRKLSGSGSVSVTRFLTWRCLSYRNLFVCICNSLPFRHGLSRRRPSTSGWPRHSCCSCLRNTIQ